MIKLYPNDFSIYSFDPLELEEHGRCVLDRLTGALGRIIYKGGTYAYCAAPLHTK